jgi:hypothetical protein
LGAPSSLRNEQGKMKGASALDKFRIDQLHKWQLAADNFKALETVKVKSFDVDGLTVKAQFNPARIVSSAAKVDKKSISERKCFLCADNRPDVQEGKTWGNYTILVNPYPIFRRHFTIAANAHTDQLIAGRMGDMAKLAEEFAGYTVFYNGPKCGASAPDHMHFQAIETETLTLPAKLLQTTDRKVIIERGDSTLMCIDALPEKGFLIDAQTPAQAAALFDKLYDAMPVAEGEKEPMMNVLCFADATGLHVVVIPRKRHRPSFYGTDGDDKMLLSPASVDMGGVFIMPLEKDFERIDADVVRRVYDELCLSTDEIHAIASKIRKD